MTRAQIREARNVFSFSNCVDAVALYLRSNQPVTLRKRRARFIKATAAKA